MPTAHGPIVVEWALEGRSFELLAKVPAGVNATVKLPDGSERSFQGERSFQSNVITIVN